MAGKLDLHNGAYVRLRLVRRHAQLRGLRLVRLAAAACAAVAAAADAGEV